MRAIVEHASKSRARHSCDVDIRHILDPTIPRLHRVYTMQHSHGTTASKMFLSAPIAQCMKLYIEYELVIVSYFLHVHCPFCLNEPVCGPMKKDSGSEL